MRASSGVVLFGSAIAFVGFISLYYGGLIDGLQPVSKQFPGHRIWIMISGCGLVASSAALLHRRSQPYGAFAIATIFGLSFILLHVPKLLADGLSLTALVAPLEVAVIVATAIAIARPCFKSPARRTCGIMLLLFAAVHWTEHAFVTSLIPDWFPGRGAMPWLTGSAMMAAGLALIANKRSQIAGRLVAAMFLSWLPIVHFGRIAADVGNSFEWSFAATAILLAGCVILSAADENTHVIVQENASD